MDKNFYIIPASNVKKVLLIESDFGFKSGDNVKASNFFLINGVPNEYQKIVLFSSPSKKRHIRLFDKFNSKQNSYFADEIISGFTFCMSSSKRLINVPFNDQVSKSGIYEVISLDLNEPVSIDEVKEFFLNLRSKNLTGAYFSSLSELFKESPEAVTRLGDSKCAYSLEDMEKVLKASIKKNNHKR